MRKLCRVAAVAVGALLIVGLGATGAVAGIDAGGEDHPQRLR